MIETNTQHLKGGDRFGDRLDYAVIYSLVNLNNGKRYIGRTHNPKQRIRNHLISLRGHYHKNKLMNADSNCPFGYEVLEENIAVIDETEKERYWILHFKTNDSRYGYNTEDPMFRYHNIMVQKGEKYERNRV